MIEIEARLGELKSMGLDRRVRMVSGPQGPHVVLDGKPVLLLCSDNYLGLADHPRVREAAADASMRWGVGGGSLAARVGDDDRPSPARGAARRVLAPRERAAVRLGIPRQRRRGRRARPPGRHRVLRRAEPRLADRRLSPVARRGVRLRPRRRRAPCLGARPGAGSRRADRQRGGVLDGRRCGAARGDRRARPAPPGTAADRREPRNRRARPRRTRRARGARTRGSRRRDPRHAREVARLLWRVCRVRSHDDAVPAERGPHAHLLHRAVTSGDRRRGWPRWRCSRSGRVSSPGCS